MIDLVSYWFLVLFGFGLGILFGWVLSLPSEKKSYGYSAVQNDIPGGKNPPLKPRKKLSVNNSTAYLDMDEWKRCIDECPYYTYESKPKKKKRKK